MSNSPHVISQADAALSRVIAESSKTPAASQYWERKRPLFRQLAIRVVQARQEGLSKNEAATRSITELRSEVLQRASTDSARQTYWEWFERRGVFLSGVAKRLWEGATMAHFPQKSIQPTGNVTLPSDGIYVALEARPNTDFPAEDWRSRLSRPLEWKRVMNLSEAVNAVDQFIRAYHLGGGNYAGMAGRVAKDGQPWAQISYNRRIWQGWDLMPRQELDQNGNPIASVEVGTTGKVAVPDAVRSYKAEMKVHGGWSANQRRYATREEADAAGKDLYSRWTAAEDYRVVPSSDAPNVEPVINVKPAEKTAQSDSRILFMHVGDAPKPAQAPKAKAALDYAPQSGAGASQESLGELLALFHSQSRILNNRFWVNRGVTGGYPEKLAEHVEDLGQRIVALAPAAAPAIEAIKDSVEAVVESLDGAESHWELAVEKLFPELFRLAKPPTEKPQEAVTEQRVLRYSLTINGLWGRKRTPDFHSVTLASRVDPKEPWPLDRLLTMMRNKVAELGVKPGAKLKLLETDVDITPDGFERITLLADRTLHTETLS